MPDANFAWWVLALEVAMIPSPGLAVFNVEFLLGLGLHGSDVVLKGGRRLVQVDGGDGVGRLACVVDVIRPVQGLVPLRLQVVACDGKLDVFW